MMLDFNKQQPAWKCIAEDFHRLPTKFDTSSSDEMDLKPRYAGRRGGGATIGQVTHRATRLSDAVGVEE